MRSTLLALAAVMLLATLAPAQRTITYGPLAPTAVESAPAPVTEARLAHRLDTRLLSGLLKKFSAGDLDQKPTRKQRHSIRRFLRGDGNLELLAWQLDNDPTIQWESCPDTGRPFQDFFCTFITNIDEIIAALEKLLQFFEGLQPPAPAPVGLVVPLDSGTA